MSTAPPQLAPARSTDGQRPSAAHTLVHEAPRFALLAAVVVMAVGGAAEVVRPAVHDAGSPAAGWATPSSWRAAPTRPRTRAGGPAPSSCSRAPPRRSPGSWTRSPVSASSTCAPRPAARRRSWLRLGARSRLSIWPNNAGYERATPARRQFLAAVRDLVQRGTVTVPPSATLRDVAVVMEGGDPATAANPAVLSPIGLSYWPLIGAFGVGISVVGLAVDTTLFWVGVATTTVLTDHPMLRRVECAVFPAGTTAPA